MKILITGDFVVNKPYSTDNMSAEVISLFQNSDYNIVNLEAPVTESNLKILKTGPHLKSEKESTLEILKALNINLCTLANNHVLDYDEQGVLDTINFCKENNIQTVGAGKNKEEAKKVFYIDSPEGKIGIINIAENEWSSATDTSAGANGMDLIDDVKAIQKAKEESDFVFVIVHGGHEYYNLPSPRMQKQYRFYIDNGADIVVGHHTHCISGMETYKGKQIYYSLGNFLFTNPSKYEDWYRGIVLKIEVSKNKNLKVIPLFVEQSKSDFNLSLLTGKEKELIAHNFTNYNEVIQTESTLYSTWQKFIKQREKTYSNYWSPLTFVSNKYLKALISKINVLKPKSKASSLFLNLLRCEAHRDVSQSVLTKQIVK